MAKATRQFRDNFEAWAQHKIDVCEFTLAEMEEWRAAIRKDLTPGPDQLRAECEYFDSIGVKRPAMLDDHEERYRLWDSFFANELADILIRQRMAA